MMRRKKLVYMVRGLAILRRAFSIQWDTKVFLSLSLSYYTEINFITENVSHLSMITGSSKDLPPQQQLPPNPLNINCSFTSFGGNFSAASISSAVRYFLLYYYKFIKY